MLDEDTATANEQNPAASMDVEAPQPITPDEVSSPYSLGEIFLL